MAAEYQRLFRSRVAQRVIDSTSSSSSGPMQSLTHANAVSDGTWRTFDAALQEQCGEGVVQRLTRDTAQRIQNAHSKEQQEAEVAKAKARMPSIVIGGQDEAARTYREQVKAWLDSVLGSGADVNYYHGVLAAFDRAGYEPALWKGQLVALQQKQNGELESFLRAVHDEYVRSVSERMRNRGSENGQGSQTGAHHVQVKPDHIPRVYAKFAEEQALQLHEGRQQQSRKEQQETAERQQQWKQKERKARQRMRRKKREKEMQPLTEYGYKIPGSEHSAKSAVGEDGLSEDPDYHSASVADRNESRGRGRSGGSAGGRTTDSPSHRNQHDRDQTLPFSPIDHTASAETTMALPGSTASVDGGGTDRRGSGSISPETELLAQADLFLDSSRTLQDHSNADLYDGV